MRTEDEIRVLLAHIDETTELLLAAGAHSNCLLDELDHEWQQARRQARLGYKRRRHGPGDEASATSRAAHDRADAGQDAPATGPRGQALSGRTGQ